MKPTLRQPAKPAPMSIPPKQLRKKAPKPMAGDRRARRTSFDSDAC